MFHVTLESCVTYTNLHWQTDNQPTKRFFFSFVSNLNWLIRIGSLSLLLKKALWCFSLFHRKWRLFQNHILVVLFLEERKRFEKRDFPFLKKSVFWKETASRNFLLFYPKETFKVFLFCNSVRTAHLVTYRIPNKICSDVFETKWNNNCFSAASYLMCVTRGGC